MNSELNEPKLLDHEADGIKELDNLLPRWWVWLFNLTIAFSVVYLVNFHVLDLSKFVPVPKSGPVFLRAPLVMLHDLLGGPKSSRGEYEAESKIGDRIKSESIAKFEVNIATLAPLKEQAVLNEGQQIYTTACAPCHRLDGGGLVGPNLCDSYWIHGSNYVDTLKTIINGVPAKGMITWRGVLKPDQIQAVGSYIYTLRGTTPTNPKPPENQQPANTGPSIYE
jgi:cytochrome c oxidase cbb3-type subunit 3